MLPAPPSPAYAILNVLVAATITRVMGTEHYERRKSVDLSIQLAYRRNLQSCLSDQVHSFATVQPVSFQRRACSLPEDDACCISY